MDLLGLLATHYPHTPPLATFTLRAAGTNNPTIGIHSGAGDFVWKCYTKFHERDSLLYEHRLLTWLATQQLSFAVPAPLRTHTGATLVQTATGWGALFPLVTGQRPAYGDPVQIGLVGAGLGELQVALARYPLTPRPGLLGYAELSRVHPQLPDPLGLTPASLGLADEEPLHSLLAWWRGEVAEITEWVAAHSARLPHQVIHGDFGPGNTLAAAGRLSAILDFEMALPDARALDVAAGLTFSMRPWENPQPQKMAAAFLAGYGEWVQLSAAEIAALPWLMRLRNAVSVLWRLGQGSVAGDLTSAITRLEEARWFSHWLRHRLTAQTLSNLMCH